MRTEQVTASQASMQICVCVHHYTHTHENQTVKRSPQADGSRKDRPRILRLDLKVSPQTQSKVNPAKATSPIRIIRPRKTDTRNNQRGTPSAPANNPATSNAGLGGAEIAKRSMAALQGWRICLSIQLLALDSLTTLWPDRPTK